jgi:hypothetical protein
MIQNTTECVGLMIEIFKKVICDFRGEKIAQTQHASKEQGTVAIANLIESVKYGMSTYPKKASAKIDVKSLKGYIELFFLVNTLYLLN